MAKLVFNPFIGKFDYVGTATGSSVVTDLDVNASIDVISLTNTPAVGPTLGDKYLIGTAPTGAWLTHQNQIAEWNGSAWIYTDPIKTTTVYATSTGFSYLYKGVYPTGTWSRFAGVAIVNNGNIGLGKMVIGSRDNIGMEIKTNNITRAVFDNSNNILLLTTSYAIMGGLEAYYPVRFKVGGTRNFWWSDGSSQSTMFIETGSMQGIVTQLAAGYGMLTGTTTNHDYIIRVNNSEAVFVQKNGQVVLGGYGASVAAVTGALLSLGAPAGGSLSVNGTVTFRATPSIINGDVHASPMAKFKGTYNNGGGSVDVDADIQHSMDTVAPTSHIAFKIGGTTLFKIKNDGTIATPNIQTFADNAAALVGGLVVDDFYKTATGELRIVV